VTKSEIINSIKGGENQKIELKSSFGKSVIETVVAFSNASGGRIIMGCYKWSQRYFCQPCLPFGSSGWLCAP